MQSEKDICLKFIDTGYKPTKIKSESIKLQIKSQQIASSKKNSIFLIQNKQIKTPENTNLFWSR